MVGRHDGHDAGAERRLVLLGGSLRRRRRGRHGADVSERRRDLVGRCERRDRRAERGQLPIVEVLRGGRPAARVLKSTDGGSTWSAQTSGTANALSGIACVSDSTCFADGTVGTILVTSERWRDSGAQQGNPISGPTTALNATSIALNGAACTASRCMVGLGVQGDIMTSAMVVDHTPPVTTATLTPGIRNGWYASPTLTLTATDGPSGSGVAETDYSLDGGPSQVYTGPISGFTTGNHFVQYHSVDVAGNVEATKLIAFKVDAVKPQVTITAPADGAQIRLDKVTAAKYKCVDRESGMDTCVGTVANGANLDTSTVGDHTFTVTATDLAGNRRCRRCTTRSSTPGTGTSARSPTRRTVS